MVTFIDVQISGDINWLPIDRGRTQNEQNSKCSVPIVSGLRPIALLQLACAREISAILKNELEILLALLTI